MPSTTITQSVSFSREWRPAQFFAADNVGVEMENGLSCLFSCVDDKAEAIFFQACFQGDFLDYQEEVSEVLVVSFVEGEDVVHVFFGITRM